MNQEIQNDAELLKSLQALGYTGDSLPPIEVREAVGRLNAHTAKGLDYTVSTIGELSDLLQDMKTVHGADTYVYVEDLWSGGYLRNTSPAVFVTQHPHRTDDSIALRLGAQWTNTKRYIDKNSVNYIDEKVGLVHQYVMKTDPQLSQSFEDFGSKVGHKKTSKEDVEMIKKLLLAAFETGRLFAQQQSTVYGPEGIIPEKK